MGKVDDRLRNRIEPFAVLFWALSIVLANTMQWTCPPAWHHSTAVHKACPYMVTVGSILNEDELPPPFLSRYVIYLCSGSTRGGRTCLLRSALLESSPLTATKKFYNEPLGEQAKILFYLVLTYISRKESILPKYLYDEVLTLYLMI